MDPRILALGLFVALPLVLWGCTLLGTYHYVSDTRYYWPILPLSIFVVYSIASTTSMSTKDNVAGFVRGTCVLYITAYLAMTLVYMTFLFMPGSIGDSQRHKLIGTAFHPWPSMGVTHEFSPARQFVMRLVKDEPQTLLMTSAMASFQWDSAIDRSRLRDMNCREDPARYITGPARILILTWDQGQPLELWYYGDEGYQRADCFEQLPDLNLLEHFPNEELKVLEARLAAGRRVVLKP